MPKDEQLVRRTIRTLRSPLALFVLLSILLTLPEPSLQQTGGINSIGVRSYCYSVSEPLLLTSCRSIRAAAAKNTTKGMNAGDTATAYMRLDYVPFPNATEQTLEREIQGENTTAGLESALGTFFPKVDVYSVLTLNGTDGENRQDCRGPLV